MTKQVLHADLEAYPLAWQKRIIRHVMQHYFCNEDLDAEDYVRFRDSDDDTRLDDIGLELWEPFEYHSNKDMFEIVDSHISSVARLLQGLGVEGGAQ